ncbi:hypothetical protein TEA_008963 [Camellia sinensis var. sinensis]|uniref:AAA+ ATPase domain-containing protein n=1 Tax=Camellia sinensis var. sinensis TaxID=542762 RepID=A0A4S4EHH1_CAMSN|nr:hypothetical protein TEA_008963 [Camellia sinensis var. sinensis]
MGSRRRGGGGGDGSPSTVFERVLCRRIESCKSNHATVDELVAYLRMNFPQYGRHKLQPFTRTVQQTLEHHMKSKKTIKSSSLGRPSTSNHHEHEDNHRPARKKTKRIDSSDERLQQSENQHIRMNQRGQSTSSLEWVSEPADGTDGAVSIFEDAVCGQKFEPEFDLMMSMLRDSGFGKRDAKGFSGGGEEEEVKGKDGLRFRDLGGMEGVVEELKMEVIVPLYHPQLPRWLGVRPMAGILLHGPPGCGKTKLAHAIANETGVPFYKISATELDGRGGIGGGVCRFRNGAVQWIMMAVSHLFAGDTIFLWGGGTTIGLSPVCAIVFSDNFSFEGELFAIVGKVRILEALASILRCNVELLSVIVWVSRLGLPLRFSFKRSFGMLIILGASEENIRELFAKEYRTTPSIVFIDKIDAIASKRENLRREMERRIVTQLMTCMDESHRLVQPVDVDPNAESSNSRLGYVLVHARVCWSRLGSLANKAGNFATKRIIDRRKSEQSREPIDENHIEDWWGLPWLPEEMENLSITMADFEEAAKLVQPSSRREGFSAIPNLLVELDGAEQRQSVYVIGATNRPVVMDRAVLWPGRFGKLLYVPLPSPDERGLILKALARKKPIDASVVLIAIGRDEACENLSGADLSALV